jgi:hypothetical protein
MPWDLASTKSLHLNRHVFGERVVIRCLDHDQNTKLSNEAQRKIPLSSFRFLSDLCRLVMQPRPEWELK